MAKFSPVDEDLNKVDDLTWIFNKAPIMNRFKKARLQDRHSRKIRSKVIKGASYHEAAAIPHFLRQEEKDFREHIKITNNDLGWQCDTVRESFIRYRETGEIPAPHYPMRVAILLRKAGEHHRERAFLAAWCRHFPEAIGGNYTKLIARSAKLGTQSPKR